MLKYCSKQEQELNLAAPVILSASMSLYACPLSTPRHPPLTKQASLATATEQTVLASMSATSTTTLFKSAHITKPLALCVLEMALNVAPRPNTPAVNTLDRHISVL